MKQKYTDDILDYCAKREFSRPGAVTSPEDNKFPWNILTKGYAIILGICVAILFCFKKLLKNQSFIAYWSISSVPGMFWIMYAYEFRCWQFPPSSVLGVEILGLTIEDFVIAPIFTALYWILEGGVYKWVSKRRLAWKGQSHGIFWIMAIGNLTMIFFLSPCGKTLSIFSIPALVILALYGSNQIVFIVCAGVLSVVAGGWDLLATSIFPLIDVRLMQWYYPAHEFLGTWRVLNSPAVIVLFFGFAGACWCHACVQIVKKVRPL